MTRAVRVSVAPLLGGAVATTVGVAITRGTFALLGNAVSPGSLSDKGAAGTIVQIVLVGLLLIAAVKKTGDGRAAEVTRTLMEATGLLVIPADAPPTSWSC
jgi:hypothetical protein